MATPRVRTPWAAAIADASIGSLLACLAVVQTPVNGLTAATTLAAWWTLMMITGLHRRDPLGERWTRCTGRVLVALGRAGIVVLATAALVAPTQSAHPLTLLAGLGASTLVLALATRTRSHARLVLVGHPRDVREAMTEIHAAGSHQVVGACLTRRTPGSFGEIPVSYGTGSALAIAEQHRAHALVVLPGRNLGPADVRRIQWAASAVGTDVFVGTGLLDVHAARTRVASGLGLDALHVAPAPLSGPRHVVKAALDRSFAAAALLLLSPLLLTVAVLVRLTSPGPALFKQERAGRLGERFEMWKFRSMSDTAENERMALVACQEADGVLFKMQHDPRVTTLGAWLRRYSIDELPQLVNVLRGEMSLVGPRPALPGEVELYAHDPHRRLAVKPGLTGLWQVSGRSDLSWDESVRLDLRYVDNWSLRLDLHILLRTVGAVVSHRGAY